MIQIFTFGGFRIVGSGRDADLRNTKSQALAVYLAGHPGQSFARSTLVDLLWPELPEASARNNLSKALGELRAIFPEGALQADRASVTLQADPGWSLDKLEFAAEIRLADQADPAGAVHHLERAAAAYRGEFLKGLALKDCPSLESWLLVQREDLMLRAREVSQQLADIYLAEKRFKKAMEHARRQLSLDSWHEAAYRQLMHALVGLGRRGDALAAYERCKETLRDELGAAPERETRALYEKIRAGETPAEPAGRGHEADGLKVRLPKQLLPLVGRQAELSALARDLADPGCRLITLTGPGGVGKTSLALEAAWQAANDFADGVCFVPLSQFEKGEEDLESLLVASIAAAVELRFSGTVAPRLQLERFLRERKMLLVLDNFEHLMAPTGAARPESGPAYLAGLMEQAPGLKLVVTSREVFGLPFEHVFELTGLPVPGDDPGPDADQFSSVRLFAEHARRTDRHFRLVPDNLPDIARICGLVDGYPLGIILAARWINHLPPSDIAAAIRRDLDFLAAEQPQVHARHQSLRATFAYSWRMLTGEEQQTLAQLSVFQGSFSRKAAVEITGAPLGVLIRLQGKSLLRQIAQGIYGLHQLLRQFAAERLEDLPAVDIPGLKRRFCEHYLRLLVGQAEGFNQAWTGRALKEIGSNLSNIQKAWRWSLEAGYSDLVLETLQPLYQYFRLLGLFHDAQRELRRAVDDYQARFDAGDTSISNLRAVLGGAMLRLGRIAWLLADTGEASRLITGGLAHLEESRDQRDLPRAYAYLSEVSLQAGEHLLAAGQLENALTLYRVSGDANGTATALHTKAIRAGEAGRPEEADRIFNESIALSRSSGNRRMAGRGMHDWGMTLVRRGSFEKAAELFAGSLAIARELDLEMPVGFNQTMLARTDRAAGRLEDARVRLAESLQILSGSGYAAYTIRAFNLMGEVLAVMDRREEARAVLIKARALLHDMQPPFLAAYEYLVLDFLLASAHLAFAEGEEGQSGHQSRLVLALEGEHTDLSIRARRLFERTGAGSDEGLKSAAAVDFTGLLDEVRL